jgi:hypothetical protein
MSPDTTVLALRLPTSQAPGPRTTQTNIETETESSVCARTHTHYPEIKRPFHVCVKRTAVASVTMTCAVGWAPSHTSASARAQNTAQDAPNAFAELEMWYCSFCEPGVNVDPQKCESKRQIRAASEGVEDAGPGPREKRARAAEARVATTPEA